MRALHILVAALALSGCSEPPAGVYLGFAEGKSVQAAPAIAGTLAELPAREGQRVAAGDLLFALDPERERAALAEAEHRAEAARARYRDLTKGRRAEEIRVLEASLREAEAALTLAKAELVRAGELSETRMIPRSELDTATAAERRARARVERLRAELEVAKLGARSDQLAAAQAETEAAAAAVEQARWALERTRVRAPAAGVIDKVHRRPGEWVAAGGLVLSLLPDTNRVVRFFVPQPELSGIRLGQRVQVACDGCPAGLTASVSFISPEAEFTPPVFYSRQRRDRLVFMIEAAIAGEAAAVLHPGLPVEVSLGRG